ncbi:sulfhydryl oxidase [Trichonephila clavipes]|nr:sulfhydryl oxidase [Trichonephila clavipes]
MDSIQVPWDTKLFQDKFHQGTPQERLEQTTTMFFFRLVALVKEELRIRTFRKPESHEALQAWIMFDLVHEGHVSALRQFMTQELSISMADSLSLAERNFEKLNFLNIVQFGSYFWCLLHWMAEAMEEMLQVIQILIWPRKLGMN